MNELQNIMPWGTPALDELPTSSVSIGRFIPSKVKVLETDVTSLWRAQSVMARAPWRPCPGRKMPFYVIHGGDLLGLIFLSSPVINLGARDEYLGLSSDPSEKGVELRQYADLSVCVPVQPFGWEWNGGKLLALLATTMGDFWRRKYGDELLGITTTSYFGRGSLYNRIFRHLGYTKGFGHEQVSDEEYARMMEWLADEKIPIRASRHHAGSNFRMRRIAQYRKESGETSPRGNIENHGNKRAIYYHPTTTLSVEEQVEAWLERWGSRRRKATQGKVPPYTHGGGGGRLAQSVRVARRGQIEGSSVSSDFFGDDLGGDR